jgi:hypothetical protein
MREAINCDEWQQEANRSREGGEGELAEGVAVIQ